MKRLFDRVKKFSHKTKNIAVALALLVTPVLSMVPAAQASAMGLTPAPQVSFTFDDGLASAVSYAAPELQKYGYTGTDYVITGCVGTTGYCPANPASTYMTWDQITQLKTTYGWEIGSHTVTHPLLSSTDPDIQTVPLTAQQQHDELANSKQALADHGFDAVAFAAPYGDYDSKVRAEAAKYYSSFRGFKDIAYNGYPYNDNLVVVQQVQAGVTVAQVKTYIDTAKANNQWLVLVFHDVKPAAQASVNPDDYEYAQEDLGQIAAYVKQQNILVSNVTNALVTAPTNLTPTGTFEGVSLATSTAPTTTWATSDPTNIKIDTATNGSYPNPTTSVSLTGSTVNNYLFSPIVNVDPAQTYVLKVFLNVTAITSGEVGFFIHQYDANGAEVPGQWKKAEPSVFVENLNFVYTPTAGVAKASLEIYTSANSGAKAYIDNVQWLSSVVTTPANPGDVNGDTIVDSLDLSTILTNWEHTGATRAQGDLNSDGVVDTLDLSTLLSNWSK